MNLCQKDRCVIGLCDKSVSSQHNAVQLVHICIAAGHKDNGNLRKTPDLRANRESTDTWQFNVQKNQVRLIFPDLGSRISKVKGCFCFVAAALKENLKLLPDHRVVFYDKNFCSTFHAPLYTLYELPESQYQRLNATGYIFLPAGKYDISFPDNTVPYNLQKPKDFLRFHRSCRSGEEWSDPH